MRKLLNNKLIRVFSILLICISGPVIAYTQVVTPELIAQLKGAGDVAITPDGKLVAYTVHGHANPLKENVPGQAQLYIMNTATGESKLYFSTSSVGSLAYRPGKGTFSFVTKGSDDKSSTLYEIAYGGGEAVKLLSPENGIISYAWRGDGNKIVYTSQVPDVTPKTMIAYKPTFYEEEMGSKAAYLAEPGSDASKAQKINVNGSVYLLSWSHDGSKLAITVAPTNAVDDSYMKQQVNVIDASSGNVLNTIDNKGKINGISWSPDGKQLALNAGKDIHDPTPGRILIVNSGGGTPAIIDAGFNGKYEHIDWEEANAIYFHASEGTASLLGSIQPDGNGKKIVFRGDAHNITSFTRSASGTYAFVASAPSHASELFTIAAGKKAVATRRTFSNEWLKNVKLGKQEVIRTKTRDGKYEIESILIYPVDYKEGTRVPLINVVHGGPESHYTNGWLTFYSYPGQMAAANGYAVVYTNYRGSTGRGVDFVYSSQGDLAGKEFDDVVDVVDDLIARGIVDKNRVGVTGGSYGGYATAWMSTYYSDRFAAGVMFVGISNNISKWGTSDIPEEMFLVHERERVWDNWEGFLKSSPIYYADKAKTPLLIMHGANDPRVYPGQSMELYRHIKVRKPDVPVRLIFYPGEGHGNRNSGSRYDYCLRMMQWFDTYLKTGNAKAPMPALDLE